MLFELAHPIKVVGDFEDFGPTHEFSEHGCTSVSYTHLTLPTTRHV